MAGLDDFENDETADDAAQARAYLDQQAAGAPPSAPLPDTQPPPVAPAGVPPAPAPAPLGQPVPEAFAAAPPPGPPSAPPAGADGTATPNPDAAIPMAEANPGPPSLADLGPPPERPKLTGDPTKDNQANLEFGQKLNDYQVALAKKQGEFQAHADSIARERATREADEERRVVTERQRQQQEFQARQQARQQQIDDAVKEKQSAYADLKNPEGTSFADKLGAAVAIAIGAIGQGYMLKGHVAGAQNEGLNAVNKQIEQDHQRKVERLKAASDSVLEARYGFKDAADNQRAALNDLDADRAAKYRLIAAEAEEQLRAQGADENTIKTNAVVVDALLKSQQSTDQITAREEKQEGERQHYKSEEDLAKAHLDQGERQIKATEAQRRETNYEHRREFDQREQDRKDAAAAAAAAKKDKQKDADEKEIVRDEGGKPIGRVPSGRGGAQQFATRDADFGRAEAQLQALADDIKANGARPLTPESIRRRQTLEENAKIGVSTVSPLGKTNEAMEAEGASIGAHGSGLLAAAKDIVIGANPAAVDRKLAEVREQRNKYRQETLRPLGDEPVPEARTADRKPAPKGDAAEAREFLKGPAKPKETPAGKITRVNMPDGSVQEFDASGKRVK